MAYVTDENSNGSKDQLTGVIVLVVIMLGLVFLVVKVIKKKK
jgi:hypothetical protein|tara:strand:+ start:884 stop:1009 length:126 start_codon:yes stop_codon:yes gene_type:complete